MVWAEAKEDCAQLGKGPSLVAWLYAPWMTLVVLVREVLGNRRSKQGLRRWIFRVEKVSGAMVTVFGVVLACKG